MSIEIDEGVNDYSFFISTREEALQNHTKSLAHITSFLFGGEADEFLKELVEYRTKTLNQQFSPTRTKIGGREILAQSANDGEFVLVTVGPKR